MCGITGKIWLDRDRPADEATVRAMTRLLIHRGPDDEGLWKNGPAALGFRRLSIIDVEGGHQPIENEDGKLALVFNGEIYNYRQLMAELQGRGHRFRTRSDSEVVLHLYEEKGPDCVRDLLGMFAFAIWDSKKKTLFMARDRLGQKPLYFAKNGECVLFASEMKSILQDASIERRLEPGALAEYLTYQYVPEPRTILQAIEKLEPATWIEFSFDSPTGFRFKKEKYWTLHYEPKNKINRAEAEELIRTQLEEAVSCRKESEVPLGVLLSGGIDSSAVVAIASQQIAGKLKTFSIGFDQASHNELPYARLVAEKFDTDHQEFIVEPSAIEALPKIVWHTDEPFGDPSALPTYFLSEMTRRHVTVALSGDGGDESFAGYSRYFGHRVLNRYANVPRFLRKSLVGPVERLLRGSPLFPVLLEKVRIVNEGSLGDFEAKYLLYMSIFPPAMLEGVWGLDPEFIAGEPTAWARGLMQESDARHWIDRKMASDVSAYLPCDLLTKVDRMSMACSLEVRSPFLDHRLMEVAARLDGEMKIRGSELKSLLKSVLRGLLPDEILDRPKQGFGVPLDDWFRHELNPLLRDVLLGAPARDRGYFNQRYVERMIDQHASGKFRHSHRLWQLLAFELWARTFLDPATAPTGPVSGF